MIIRILVCFGAALLVPAAAAQMRAEREAEEELTQAVAGVEQPVDPPGAPVGHLEVPDDPYAPPPAGLRATSPGGYYERNGYVSVQVNVDQNGNNIVGDAANEPSIAVDPTNPNRMAIGWRQFDTITSNFRQAGWGYTDDGGFTWTFPDRIEPGIFRSDPVLDSDADGVFYYNSLTTPGGIFTCDVFRSQDGGATWGAGVFAYGGDKQWQAIDRTDGPGRNNIYAYWSSNFSACDGNFTRSYDGGNTWRPCTTVPGNLFWGVLDVGPDGELYGIGAGFTLAKSSTMQYEGLPTAWDFTRTVDLDGYISSYGYPNPGGLLGQAWVAVDHSMGPFRGNVYVLGSVQRSSTPDPLDVMFARSTDGGATFSPPVRVNDDSEDSGALQWFGTLSVAPTGRIDVVWYDTRSDPGGYLSELYYSSSFDAGETWTPGEVLSPQFNSRIGWPSQNKLGDYIDMVSDELGANLAYAATFNGEQDVYFVRIGARQLWMSFVGGVPALLDPGVPTDLTVRVVDGSEAHLPGTGTLHYRFDDGEFLTLPLTPLEGGFYGVTLPPAGCDAKVEFFASVEGEEGTVITSPPDAPNVVYAPFVGRYQTLLEDNCETDQGWTAINLGASAGDWERGVPVADPAWNYAPAVDADGSGQCWLTGNQMGNSDVDDGAVQLVSPAYDLARGGITLGYSYALFLAAPNGQDVLAVEIDGNDGQGPWIPIATHREGGPGEWRSHSIEPSVFDAAGVEYTSTMRVRFTLNDGVPQSIVEGGLDAFTIVSLACDAFPDCNENGYHDAAELQLGYAADCNGNDSPDECDPFSGGDYDLDQDVDLFDFDLFRECLKGPLAWPIPDELQCLQACLAGFDANGDEHVDLRDFAYFQGALRGPE